METKIRVSGNGSITPKQSKIEKRQNDIKYGVQRLLRPVFYSGRYREKVI